MALISLQEASLAFGGPPILDRVSLNLEPRERVALLGRNGAGKTTLLKALAGELPPDSGIVTVRKGASISHLPQEIPQEIRGNVFDIVLAGLGARGRLLAEYQRLSRAIHDASTPELLGRLDALGAELDATGAWDTNAEVELVVSRMALDPESDFALLSGGQKRRVLLARALVCKPDVLLLDEPTNHLDIETIGWLEEFLKGYPGSLFFVTHDRMFMRHLATRIMELDRGQVYSWACDYDEFLKRKQATIEVEEAHRRQFEKKLAEEEIWIRQGVQARRCRNEGRVKALERLREDKKARRSVEGKVAMQAQETLLSGRQVIKAVHAGFSYDQQRWQVRDLTAQVMRGDKIGVIGPNGSGKTTLLKLLLGQLPPHKGKVRLGTNLEIAYFDQLREQLDPEKTVMQNVCGDADTVIINGKPRHIIGYLQEFLFTPDRARTPVKVLSGGERNRLLLARLFTRPFNLLVMDEPTNDLDIETLELLEELLLDYPGTLILVSHDRQFLNNVVSSTMALEGGGVINEYPGGYDDWLLQRPVQPQRSCPKYKPVKAVPVRAPATRQKLSFNERRELESLPAKIEKLEAEQQAIYSLLGDLAFCRDNPGEIARSKLRLAELEKELPGLYRRWEELERQAP